MDPQGPAARAISRDRRILVGEPVTLVTAASGRDNRVGPPQHQPHQFGPRRGRLCRDFNPTVTSRAGFPPRSGAAWSRPPVATHRRPGRRCRASARRTGIPIYAYVRHRGHTPEQAQDLTQDFFAYILERDLIAMADPTRGRFRAFLRTVCARQLAAHRDRRERGEAGRRPVPALHRPLRRRTPVRAASPPTS